MPPVELILKNARIVTPSGIVAGSVHICGETIAEVDLGPLRAPGVDCEGDLLVPGLIDLHTDNYETHSRPRAAADWPLVSALLARDAQMACAGVTTTCDALSVGVQDAVRSYDMLAGMIGALKTAEQSRILRSDHLLHLRVELPCERSPEMLSSVFPDPMVRVVSLMDHTPGQRQYPDPERLFNPEKKEMGRQQLEEIERRLQDARARQERYSAENRARIIAMVRGHEVVLAGHDDQTVEHVEQSHAEGVSISEFPTTRVAAEAARARGVSIVGGSPNLVLGRSHSGNVAVEELARLDLLDALASDYVPLSLLHGAFLLESRIGIPLEEAISKISLNPARLIGLDDRGSIEAGKRGDLVRVRKAQEVPVPWMVWRRGERVA